MKDASLILHCGAQTASFSEVCEVLPPEHTRTWKPIPYRDLLLNVQEKTTELLIPKGYKAAFARFGLGKEGLRMFGVFGFSHTDSEEYCLAIGVRQSYDKSMSAGICIGANVFVCDNLAFNGDVTVFRKNTSGIADELGMRILQIVYRADGQFKEFHSAVQQLRGIGVTLDEGFGLLGRVYGHEILTPRQMLTACRDWRRRAEEERTRWGVYNVCTAALKTTPVQFAMERHLTLHRLLV